jgi:hypothetical protein
MLKILILNLWKIISATQWFGLSNFCVQISFIICKVWMIKKWYKLLMMFQESLCIFKTLLIFLWTIFLRTSFFVSNVYHPFSKLERILILMIKGATWVEILEIHVYNTFWHFWLKHVFDLEIYEFWLCFQQIKYIFIWQKTWMHNIHDIRSRCKKKNSISHIVVN